MEKMGIDAQVSEFEKIFEDMDVKTAEMDAAMENVYQGSISQDEVANLLGEIQAENAMATGADMGGVGVGAVANPSAAAQANDVDEMQNRLNQLNNMGQ